MSDKRFIPKRIVESCGDCPYCDYDYRNCGPSGYVCEKTEGDKRYPYKMIYRWEMHFGEPDEYYEKRNDALSVIPDWCPLEKEK